MKLHRKIKHIEKVCRAHDLGSYAQGQGGNQVRGKNRFSAITRKLLKQLNETLQKDKHNEKVCRAQELGSYAQEQGHNQVRGQIIPEIVLLIDY